MITVPLYDFTGNKAGEHTVEPGFFLEEPKTHLFHEVVRAKLADKRQGTHSTKLRYEVSGGGKKPFKQKGTGNARQGSSRSPLMPGGGICFGPKPRSYHLKVNKKVRKLALQSALSVAYKANKFFVFKDFAMNEAKTKTVATVLQGTMKLTRALLIDVDNKTTYLSVRNLPKFSFSTWDKVSVYDVLHYDSVLVTQAAMAELAKRFAA